MNTDSGSSRKILKRTMGPAFATLASRVLGLIRVMLEARVLGGGALASAWQLAFSIPNTLRRLFGEGALGTALIPLVAESDVKAGRKTMRRQLAVVFSALSVLLALIIVLVAAGALLMDHAFDLQSWTPRCRYALKLLPLLMPYGLFMCLVGVIGAVLNTQKQFFLPALGALLLNAFLIAGLAWGRIHKISLEPAEIIPFLRLLTWLVLTSGLVQLLLMAALLAYYRCFPCFTGMTAHIGILKQLWHLMLPGFWGASALQLSFFADRFMALSIGDQAIPALSNVDRLIDLPIGIFALSLGQVLMATLSRSAANGEYSQMSKDLFFSLRHVYFVCIPLGVAVVALWRPMLAVLCLGGNYTASDLEATRLVALFYGAGIPFFCSTKVLLPAFYARKEMRYPFYVSLTTIALNVTLNYCLMHFLKQGGIALATVISAMAGNLLLLGRLEKEGFSLDTKRLAVTFLRSLLCAVIAAWAARCVNSWLTPLPGQVLIMRIMVLAISLTVMAAVYFVLCGCCRAPETGEIFSLLRRRVRS